MYLFFLGDSLVLGAGDESYRGWPGRLCAYARSRKPELVELTMYNLGIRGNTSEQIRARFQSEVQARLKDGMPNAIVFSFGVNDTAFLETSPEGVQKTKVSRERFAENIRALLNEAKKYGPVVFVGPPAIDEDEHNKRIAVYSADCRNICQEFQIPFFDSFHVLRENKTWRDEVSAGDGFHPSARGYEEFFRLLKDWSGWKNIFEF